MRQSAAAGLFPSQMLIEDLYLVSGAGQLLPAHRTGRSTANDCDLCHDPVSLLASTPSLGEEPTGGGLD
jgi:hypothetical protein